MFKDISLAESLPLLLEVIGAGGEFHIFPRGTSMLPLLREGTDSVMLAAIIEPRPRDVILYRRDSGAFVLHRAISVKNGLWTFCGDSQSLPEHGIRRDQMIAVMTGFYRGDRYVPCDHPEYLRYAARIVRSLPFRAAKRKLRGKIHGLKLRLSRRR